MSRPKNLPLEQICIDHVGRPQVNEQYIAEFADLLAGRRANVSPEAWFWDVTYIPDQETEALIFESCSAVAACIPMIDDHPKFGRVFHTLLIDGRAIKKGIAVAFAPPAKAATGEELIEDAVCCELSRRGIDFRRQVLCRFGRADIVTATRIFEVKEPLSRQSAFQAIGQVLAYRRAINPAASVAVVGRIADPEVSAICCAVGVEAIELNTFCRHGGFQRD